jgi:hypothetical protein
MAFLNLNDPYIGDPAPQERSHRVGATPAWKEQLLAGLQALFDGLHTLATITGNKFQVEKYIRGL